MPTDDQYRDAIRAVKSGSFSQTDLDRVETMAGEVSAGFFPLVDEAREAKRINDARNK